MSSTMFGIGAGVSYSFNNSVTTAAIDGFGNLANYLVGEWATTGAVKPLLELVPWGNLGNIIDFLTGDNLPSQDGQDPNSPSSPAGNPDGSGGQGSGEGDGGSPISYGGPAGPGSGCGSAASDAGEAAAMDGAASLFGGAEAMISPIVLDLDGDGIETTKFDTNGVYFDLNANGFAEQSGWVKSDDGLLVLDRNGNGTVDNGNELFGDYTVLEDGKTAPNGFSALIQLDDNLDGKIDTNDIAYNQLKIWRDFNQNGLSESSELSSLNELGISSLTTSYQNVDVTDAQGNTKKQQSTFELIDGTIQEMSDYYFKTNQMNTIPMVEIPIPEDIAALPDISGSGTVYSLRQAMAQDTSGELKGLVESLLNETDPVQRTTLVDEILLKWTGSESIDPNSMGTYVDARQLNIVESFMGQQYLGVHGYIVFGPDAGSALSQSYQEIREMVYSRIMSQTGFKDLYDMIVFKQYEERQSIEGNLGAVREEFETRFIANPDQTKTDIAEFFRTLRGLNLAGMMQDYWYTRNILAGLDPELGWLIDSSGKNYMQSTTGDDTITGTRIDDAIAGGDGDDILEANDMPSYPFAKDNNVLYGNCGNDSLLGGSGNDILDGGTGDDTLQGGQGDDVYLYGIGSGNDTIISYEPSYSNGFDTVQLIGTLKLDDIDILQNGENLIIQLKSTGETITADRWFMGEERQFNQIRSTDNHILTAAELSDRAIFQGTNQDDVLDGSQYHGDKIYGLAGNDVVHGSGGGNDQLFGGEGNDELWGWDGDDVLNGDAGNDKLYGFDGNDILDGGSGDDLIQGGNGDDILDGVIGDDTLQGGSGNDVYVFGIGSGNDQIDNYASDSSNTIDVIQMGDGITKDSIDITLPNYYSFDLLIKIKSTGETLTVKNWFADNSYTLDKIQFSDGSYMTAADIEGLITLKGTENADSLTGSAKGDRIYGFGGNDQIMGKGGNDIIDGGAGDDLIFGGQGDDIYIYGVGSGNDTVSNYEPGYPNGFDTVQLIGGLTASDVDIVQEGENFVLRIKSTGEKLVTGNWFKGPDYQFDQIRFDNGDTLSAAEITNEISVIGTAGVDNNLSGSLYHDDKIYGLAGDDHLYGWNGNDYLDGGDGNDYLDGGTGNDTMVGGLGNDTYIVETIGDTVIELPGGGTDLVQSTFTYTLGDNVENLTLVGTTNINGTGNALNNTIRGTSGNNVLDGGFGADTLLGGSGDDTYIVDNIGDVVSETVSAGIDTVLSSVNFTLGYYVENLTLLDNAITGNGNSINNIITGNNCDNSLNGNAGNDTLDGKTS